MKEIIDRIYKRTTEYSHPSQATTIANSLELLSSGIYTEEERFVFELLQNAVDSYDGNSNGLDVRIVVGNGQLIFMHTGKAFSERDLEGLCDIGNGNKMSDAKKIGYKGIGFKSVFMHSKRVTVVTGSTCFRFDEEACKQLASQRGSDYQDVKMPWQIIPILSDFPEGLDYDAYNVVTILEVSNTEKLLKKVEKLLSDARFLLFLKVANLRVSLFKDSSEILSLSKTQEENILTLAKNDVAQSRWLMFAKDVEIPADVKEDLIHDAKTPAKLKDSNSVEISFAIALDKDEHIVPIKDAVVYTYLPTSFSFGFEFVVNANFITDAGRQQLIKDCEWNKFIFSQIPSLFLNWIKDEIAPNHKDWYKVLLPFKTDSDDLTIAYSTALKVSLREIPFIRSLSKNQITIDSVLFDKINFANSLPTHIFDLIVRKEISNNVSFDTLVDMDAYAYLKKYDVNEISLSIVHRVIDKATNYISQLSDTEILSFLIWLYNFSLDKGDDFASFLKQGKFIPDENNELQNPETLFFPSKYRDQIELANDAKVIRQSLYDTLSGDIANWLGYLGVKEISPITIIEKVICENDYITEDNAIEAIRFLFLNNKENQVFTLPSYRLKNLKFLTQQGTLKSISQLYLSNAYRPQLQIEHIIDRDIFISEAYIKGIKEIPDWSFFFQKLGINIDFSLNMKEISIDSARSEGISLLTATIEPSKKIGYDSRNGDTYYFYPSYFRVNYFPLMPETPDNSMWAFAQYFWTDILSKSKPKYKQESIEGTSGWISRSLYLDNFTDGKSYFDWLLMQKQTFPTTTGEFMKCNQIVENTESNISMLGKYFPVLAINTKIDPSWLSILPFKDKLTLVDYLTILENISHDDSNEQITDNLDRLCNIIDRITDNFNLNEGSDNFQILRDWGKNHKILSAKKKFDYPVNLCLVSSRIYGVELDNQVYQRASQRNNRFADLMFALGVNMITEHRVEGLEDAVSQDSVKESILNKEEFLAALTLNGETSKQKWDEAVEKMHASISAIRFYSVPSIQVIYGKQSIEKAVYVSNSDVYFVGKFGLAVQELLHGDIVRLIGLHKNDSSTFLTLMGMSDFDEMIEYLKLKGYCTQYISHPTTIEKTVEDSTAIMKGEDAPGGDLSNEQKRVYLEEAKEAILHQMSCEGFDISDYKWNGWTCIDGIKKDGKEYPLVIRSNKSGRNTVLSAPDWDQLMKENAMFVVNTNSGIGTVNFKQLLRSKDNITIRFGSENIDQANRISRLAEAFAFFKGMQFDFESYIRPTISRWQSFMAPELETGEQAGANPSIPLPE